MNRTILRAFETLDYISKSEDGLTLTEVMEKLDIPKSSAFNIIQTLVSINMLKTSQYNEKKYQIGSSAYRLGMKYIERLDFIDICKKHLDPLADELHRNGFVGILDGNKVLYIHKHVGIGAKLAVCDVGTRQGLYYTGLGKVLLAYLPEKKMRELMENMEYVKKTENTIDNFDDLIKELELIRKRGFAIDNREIELHMMCFAAPVFNYAGECVAAISVSDIYTPEIKIEEIGARIKDVALKISYELGYIKKSKSI